MNKRRAKRLKLAKYQYKQLSSGFTVKTEPNSIYETAFNAFNKRNISWRKCGLDGKSRRPIRHRFEIKGGDTILDAMKENLMRTNLLLSKLAERGK